MHISLFIGQMEGGGAEKVLSMLANHYCKQGYEVDIAMLLGDKVEWEHFALDRRIRIVDLSIKGSYRKNAISWLKRIRQYLKETKPNAVISFIGRINALVLTAALGLHIPTIVSERSDPQRDQRGRLMLSYCNWIYRFADAIVFQTTYQQGCFSKHYLKRSHIIPNPVPTLQEPDYNIIDPSLVVTTGRLHPAKNHHMLIKAMDMVHQVLPHVRCEIYGDGDLQEELQREIDNMKLGDTVYLMGKKSNVTDYVAKCGVFVMTSDYEGLSNSLMEAMMLGKVCVSTDYPGVEDLIENGVNGIIVPRGDVNGLAKSIVEIINEKDNRIDNFRKNARLKMMGNDESSVLSKWDSVLERVMNTKPI